MKSAKVLALIIATTIAVPATANYTKGILQGAALASTAAMVAGAYKNDDSLLCIGLGSLTGTLCGALEYNGVNPIFTWLGERAIRIGALSGPDVQYQPAARASSWIAYLTYQFARAKDAQKADAQAVILEAAQVTGEQVQ